MVKIWGFCPVCHQSVECHKVKIKNRKASMIAPHWGGQEMCFGSDMPWGSQACIPIKKSNYQVAIEEIPCNNTL